VVKIPKPMSWNRRAIGTAPARSCWFTVIITFPSAGSPFPAASCAFPKAIPNDSAIPITSPVERISGPRIGSNSRNLVNGNTASFTETNGAMISAV
jgi:hypothetical protein